MKCCPIMSVSESGPFIECQEEQCAWWDKEPGTKQRCAVLAIAYFVKKIPMNIAAIGQER